MIKKPLISIITVSFNAVDTIEQTILSVINQSYSNIEYIIIDGGSTDGTIDIIKKYENKISFWMSEPDKGIYDAMNKGINLSNGEWVNFMNCGDWFASNECIDKNIEYFNDNKLVIYSDNIRSNYKKNQNSYRKASKINKITRGMVFCHQSSFIHKPKENKLYYNLDYKICADYELFLRIYLKHGTKAFAYVDEPISVYEIQNGISSKFKNKLYKEKLQIHLKEKLYFSLIIDIIHYTRNVLNSILSD